MRPRGRITAQVMPKTFCCLLFLCALVVSNVCRAGASEASLPGTIHVQVRYGRGQAIPSGVMVLVESERGGLTEHGQTDSLGRFSLAVGTGAYRVTVKHPGYLDSWQRADLSVARTAQLSFELQAAPKANPVLPAGGSGAQVSVAALAVPASARKEFAAGTKLLEKNKAQASIQHFCKAIALHEKFADAHAMLGIAYLEQKQWADAQDSLERALQLDPKLSAALLGLGVALNRQKNYREAEQVLRRGLEINPYAAEGYYELAKNCSDAGRSEEAEAYALKATAKAPLMPIPHLLLGNLLLRKRDTEGALREYKHYLTLDPDGEAAAAARAAIARIENKLASK
jgi:tetratricopeptide (TPR) repeat protein